MLHGRCLFLHGVFAIQYKLEAKERVIESAEEFVRLRTSEIMEEYNRAAHDEAPESVWLDVIARYPDMREWVAHNKKIPLSILEILAGDERWRVRLTVAMKRKLSQELIVGLSGDPDESVRVQIARHPKAPLAVVQKLAKDREALVREAADRVLASNHSLQGRRP